MKHNYNDFAVLAELVYVDSMQNLKDAGYRRPGPDALCEELKIERRGHSALDDAYVQTHVEPSVHLAAGGR